RQLLSDGPRRREDHAVGLGAGGPQLPRVPQVRRPDLRLDPSGSLSASPKRSAAPSEQDGVRSEEIMKTIRWTLAFLVVAWPSLGCNAEGGDPRVMTQNLYFGFDTGPLLSAASPEDIPVLA